MGMPQNQSENHHKLMKPSSSRNLLQCIQEGNKIAVNMHLTKFKEGGAIAFDKLLSISFSDRIPALTKNDTARYEMIVALSASLRSAFSNMNLRVGFNEDQVIELAVMIIDQSHEDQLGLEDVLLFLQKLLVGEYGKIYDRMDIPTFFEMFEKYRQSRHVALKRIQEEQHVQNKSYGSPDRWAEMSKDEERNAFHEAMKTYVKDNPPKE